MKNLENTDLHVYSLTTPTKTDAWSTHTHESRRVNQVLNGKQIEILEKLIERFKAKYPLILEISNVQVIENGKPITAEVLVEAKQDVLLLAKSTEDPETCTRWQSKEGWIEEEDIERGLEPLRGYGFRATKWDQVREPREKAPGIERLIYPVKLITDTIEGNSGCTQKKEITSSQILSPRQREIIQTLVRNQRVENLDNLLINVSLRIDDYQRLIIGGISVHAQEDDWEDTLVLFKTSHRREDLERWKEPSGWVEEEDLEMKFIKKLATERKKKPVYDTTWSRSYGEDF